MKHSIKVGFSFGITSAIITTLGLMVGLYSGTGSRMVVIGGILMIAISDSCSDALGIHISEESEGKHTKKEIWESTFSTFFFKFIFASLFVVPFLIFNLKTGIIINIFIGLLLLSLFSFKLSKKQKRESSVKVIFEHLIIAVLVILVTYYLGKVVNQIFV